MTEYTRQQVQKEARYAAEDVRRSHGGKCSVVDWKLLLGDGGQVTLQTTVRVQLGQDKAYDTVHNTAL